DRRHPGTSAETNPDLLTVGPPLVPAGGVAPPPARKERPGPTADWEAASGLAAWCCASPVDGLNAVPPGIPALNSGRKSAGKRGIEYARRLLWHANISTTQRYMHLDERQLADGQDLVE